MRSFIISKNTCSFVDFHFRTAFLSCLLRERVWSLSQGELVMEVPVRVLNGATRSNDARQMLLK